MEQYFVDQDCRKSLAGQFSNEVYQEVTARYGLELEPAEGSTGLVIEDVFLIGLAVNTGCHWAFSWVDRSSSIWHLQHGGLRGGLYGGYCCWSEHPRINCRKLTCLFLNQLQKSPCVASIAFCCLRASYCHQPRFHRGGHRPQLSMGGMSKNLRTCFKTATF